MESHKLFAWAGLELQSSQSLPSQQLGLQAQATTLGLSQGFLNRLFEKAKHQHLLAYLSFSVLYLLLITVGGVFTLFKFDLNV
jgi:hypothetical protein